MEVRPRRIITYFTPSHRSSYDEWFEDLSSKEAQAIISVRIARVEAGNFGDCRRIDRNIWELKINFGPGYRIYYAEDGYDIVLLLCGGDKSSQIKDIRKAQAYWAEYTER